MLTNPSDKPADVRLRSHLELDLGQLRETRLQFTNVAGKRVTRDMPPILDRMREGERFENENMPSRSWSFSGTKGLRLTQRFDPKELDFTWVYSYPEYLGEFEIELWAKRTVLAPGQSVSIHQEIEIQPAS